MQRTLLYQHFFHLDLSLQINRTLFIKPKYLLDRRRYYSHTNGKLLFIYEYSYISKLKPKKWRIDACLLNQKGIKSSSQQQLLQL